MNTYGEERSHQKKSKSGAMDKDQRIFMVLKTTSNVKELFKGGAVPLYHLLVTSLVQH